MAKKTNQRPVVQTPAPEPTQEPQYSTTPIPQPNIEMTLKLNWDLTIPLSQQDRERLRLMANHWGESEVALIKRVLQKEWCRVPVDPATAKTEPGNWTISTL
jgi:hypothetical protein